MKRIRITRNRSDIAVALRKAVEATGASVSDFIRDIDDTWSPQGGADSFVFVTDAENVEIPANYVGIVTIREAKNTDPVPLGAKPKESPQVKKSKAVAKKAAKKAAKKTAKKKK